MSPKVPTLHLPNPISGVHVIFDDQQPAPTPYINICQTKMPSSTQKA
jgi:hypothetical protein